MISEESTVRTFKCHKRIIALRKAPFIDLEGAFFSFNRVKLIAIVLLFVYGTLRSGFAHTFRQLMESQTTFLSYGTVNGRLYDLGSYPGLILTDDSTDIVHGEVYQVHNESLIRELDLYENYRKNDPGSLYIRSLQKINMNDGRSVEAIVYTYNKSLDNAIRITEGDYKTYLSR